MMTIEQADAFVKKLHTRLAPLGLDGMVVLDGLNARDIRHFSEICKEILTERPRKIAAPPPVE